MLAGQRAFNGASMADLMSAILKEDPAELSETNAKISPALDKSCGGVWKRSQSGGFRRRVIWALR